MLNQCTFMGRLVKKPELRKSVTDKSYTYFTLAVTRDHPNKDGNWIADFIEFVAWNNVAERICEKYNKGDMLCVSSQAHNRQITTRDGMKQTILEFVASNCYRVTSSKHASNETPAATGPAPSEDYQQLEDEDAQLPF